MMSGKKRGIAETWDYLNQAREMQATLVAKTEAGAKLLGLLELPPDPNHVSVAADLDTDNNPPVPFCDAIDCVVLEADAYFCRWVRAWCRDLAVEVTSNVGWTDEIHKLVYLFWRHMKSNIATSVLARAIKNGIEYDYSDDEFKPLVRALVDELAGDPFMAAHPPPFGTD